MSCLLVKLAPELLQMVIQCTHPSSHFALALTCRHIYTHSKAVFQRHRAAYENGALASDISPQGVLELLDSCKPSGGAEGIEAWHVRELEIWGPRRSWSRWRHWDTRNPTYIAPYGEIQSVRAEVMQFLDHPPFLQRVSHLFAEEAHDDCLRGDDGYIKMLLITSLPRLRELRFANRLDDRHSSLKWLGRAISRAKETGDWPLGLQSLRKVVVGITLHRGQDNLFLTRRPVEFARLMCLPNLEDLYFSHLHAEEEQSDDEDYDIGENDESADDGETGAAGNDLAEFLLSPGSSNVSSLFLDNISSFTPQLLECIAQAPRKLQSFVVRGLYDTTHPVGDMDQLVYSLTENQCESLEKMLFYNLHGLAGFPFSIYTPAYMGLFSKLRIVNIDLNDAEAFATEAAKSKNPSRSPKSFVTEFCGMFPASLEAVAFLERGDFYRPIFQDKDRMERTEDAMIAMVESDNFPSLKAVYIHYAEHEIPGLIDFGWSRLVEVGRRRRVGVHTSTSQNALDLDLEFVGKPDKFDLKSGKYGKRDESWIVSKYTGNQMLRE